MNWEQLLSNKRLGQEENSSRRKDDRTEFQRDYDRLIFSSPFRRLQNKTQVFPLPGSIFVHNRLTHSLEVSSVGRSLGNDVSRQLLERHPELSDTHLTELGAIVSAACLAHDMGNPPFGHSGERAIAKYFSEGGGQWLQDYVDPVTGDHLTAGQWNDLTHFEGNANAFRLLTHHFVGRRPGGFVMTYSTLASIVKYPFSSDMAGSHQKPERAPVVYADSRRTGHSAARPAYRTAYHRRRTPSTLQPNGRGRLRLLAAICPFPVGISC